MDPLTQGTLGAALPQSVIPKQRLWLVGLFGFIAGLLADLDVLIRSSADPLLFLEYHRQFTHSLIFIPVGGAIAGLALHFVLGRRFGLRLAQSLLFATLGYGTHALLDAATTYGTQLFWPFSDERFSFSIVSIIDPLFTLPLLAGVLAAACTRRNGFARAGLVWGLCYLGIGWIQQGSALDQGRLLAEQRGHEIVRIEAKPSFANLLVWKTLYETETHFHVDAHRVGWRPRHFEGSSLPKLDLERDLPWLNPQGQQADDVERFRHFSDGFIALAPGTRGRIIDVRYSFVPNEFGALWSINLNPDAVVGDHARFETHREDSRAGFQRLLELIKAP
ncbi:MAG: metal-dependent hydrolase [Magnetovibrionaceae bacterium]